MTTSPAQPPVASRRIIGAARDELAQRIDLPPSTTTIAAIMSRVVFCVRPDVSVELLARLLLEHDVSGFPVVDDDGRAIGVITKTDLVRHLHERGIDRAGDASVLAAVGRGDHADQAATTVGELMMPAVFTLAHGDPVVKAAAVMAAERIHRVPIVDDDGRVCGLVSALDVMRWLADLGGYDVT